MCTNQGNFKQQHGPNCGLRASQTLPEASTMPQVLLKAPGSLGHQDCCCAVRAPISGPFYLRGNGCFLLPMAVHDPLLWEAWLLGTLPPPKKRVVVFEASAVGIHVGSHFSCSLLVPHSMSCLGDCFRLWHDVLRPHCFVSSHALVGIASAPLGQSAWATYPSPWRG